MKSTFLTDRPPRAKEAKMGSFRSGQAHTGLFPPACARRPYRNAELRKEKNPRRDGGRTSAGRGRGHGTWMADLADARQRFDTHTNANVREIFAQVLRTPSKTDGLRLDVRGFHLDRATDPGHAGNGAAQNRG